MEPSDESLVRGVLDHDREAFAALFRRYQVEVRQHLARILRDPAAAEDLTQEVFLRLWHRAAQWRAEAPFRSWLLRLATNLALNHLRTVRRRREQPLQVVGQEENDEDGESLVPGWMIDASTLQPDDVLIRNERQALLRQLLDELPAEKQEVLRMVYDAHMEVHEVAAQLGIPEGTVKSRMHHARQRLARSWEERHTEGEET